MSTPLQQPTIRETLAARANALFGQQHTEICVSTDRMFAQLMIFQWLAGIGIALWISPKAWAGPAHTTHPHVWGAMLVGGALTFFPVFLALRRPGSVLTRQLIAAAQVLTSALLIHLTGGRIETHFHVFGSLAFLTFYRDPRVIITATVVVTADHLLRGFYWPQSIFGVINAPMWRAFEHAGWVIFEDFFLILYIRRSLDEMQRHATQHTQLEATNKIIELTVQERTSDLQAANISLKLSELSIQNLNHTLVERAADLERSNQELEQFAYVASHDLQEPLRAVAGCVEILENDYRGKFGNGADGLMRHAVEGSRRMQALINDLLSYARIATRGQPLEPTDVAVVLAQTLENLRTVIGERHAVITHDSLPTLTADPSQLRQLFQNLISNGIKFCTAERPEIHIGAEQKESGWLFSVRDNGIGIDPQYRQRIFVIFQRLHQRQEYPGTGIGLAICKRIVERHGGQIWLESEPGQGSTFYFNIPDKNKP